MVFADLIAFIKLLAHKNGPRVPQVGCIADVVVDENNKSTTATIISFLFPLIICLNKSFSQSCRHVFSPIRIEKVLMQLLLKELRTFSPTVSVINAKPLSIFLKVNSDFVIIRLSIKALMSNCCISFKMRTHVSTNSFRNFWEFLCGFFGRLFLFALLAGVIQKWALQSLGYEVGSYSVLNNAGT